MDLKEFIKTALLSIVEGIEEAKNILDATEKNICPPMAPAYIDKLKIPLNAGNGFYYQQAEFDVAVTVENQTEGKTKAGIKVLGIGANIDGSMSSSNTTVSRIKFHVPLGLQAKRTSEDEIDT